MLPEDLDALAEELVKSFLNGNKNYVIETIGVGFHPVQSAYLAFKISQLLPESNKDSFVKSLANRV